jgi:hypothetical protein
MPTFDQSEQAYIVFKYGAFIRSPHAHEAYDPGATSKATEGADYLDRLSHLVPSTCSFYCSFVPIVNAADLHMPRAVCLPARLGRVCRR